MERWGMLNGTEAGRWISLLVRQKRPLPGKGTGGIGDLKVESAPKSRSDNLV